MYIYVCIYTYHVYIYRAQTQCTWEAGGGGGVGAAELLPRRLVLLPPRWSAPIPPSLTECIH